MIVYVAGPFRGPNVWAVEQNIRRAEDLAMEVWKLGAVPVTPHLLGRFTDKVFPDEFMLASMRALLERCDALLLAPGWDRSAGTLDEVVYAKQTGKLIFSTVESLRDFLSLPRSNTRSS
jgi:hypothetical protein